MVEPALWGVAWQVATDKWIGRCYLCLESGDATTAHSEASAWLRGHVATEGHRVALGRLSAGRRATAGGVTRDPDPLRSAVRAEPDTSAPATPGCPT